MTIAKMEERERKTARTGGVCSLFFAGREQEEQK
jgi:hypothetical protein